MNFGFNEDALNQTDSNIYAALNQARNSKKIPKLGGASMPLNDGLEDVIDMRMGDNDRKKVSDSEIKLASNLEKITPSGNSEFDQPIFKKALRVQDSENYDEMVARGAEEEETMKFYKNEREKALSARQSVTMAQAPKLQVKPQA